MTPDTWPAWRPIETAPKNGAPILLHDRVVGLLTGWWDGTAWCHSWDNETIANQEWITHWLPLPPPPGGGMP